MMLNKRINRKMLDSTNKQVHVVLRREGWAVEKRGASRAIRIYENKEDAVKAASIMRKRGYDVIVHERDGVVQGWDKALA